MFVERVFVCGGPKYERMFAVRGYNKPVRGYNGAIVDELCSSRERGYVPRHMHNKNMLSVCWGCWFVGVCVVGFLVGTVPWVPPSVSVDRRSAICCVC